MRIKTIDWVDSRVRIIDQTELPAKLKYLNIYDLNTIGEAIKQMKVRGAPALAAAAAFAVVLGIKDSRCKNYTVFKKELDKIVSYVRKIRPTAVNLFWGLERMLRIAQHNRDKPVARIKEALLNEAKKIIKQDMTVCRRMARIGVKLVRKGDNILTICNAGILATIDYGTALGLVYEAKKQGRSVHVFACETRPLLQGARLTTWELNRKGIKVTLICDNLAATLMRQGKVDKVIVGADRIAANGDVANKIGTYNMAALANFHKIPFYVVAPLSSFDPKIKNGSDIPIEQRDRKEVTELFFKRPIAPQGMDVMNPAFDITPHRLVTAIVTERGIIKPPYKRNIAFIFKPKSKSR